ncbi:amino acid ABC transporter permease [Catenisphaera adipataccumulans]|jgi:cystine transport system permease protein|uniref:Cystine transport system permease protein n=1 Tax=Catenisphaera adipataccumulans TaxID=700500 RepID=A0A7W8CZW2_9FIRM|nr:amino acid ABC transporter permease [Catenisphaera adipataccumulans]MBB5183439.1 cystine transport system permease protein [Catenisphaera adipataccumulans]
MNTEVLQLWKESFWTILQPGLQYTIPLTLVSFGLGLLIAILSALCQVGNVKVFKQIFQLYVWIFRGTPLLVQLFIVFYGLPNIGIMLEAIPSAILTFSLNVGAYASETIRGSILAVDTGQKEAAYACGFTYAQTMYHIVLPQAIKNSIPALFNTFIGLVKDTSLAANITVAEMFQVTQNIVARTYEPLWLYIEVAFIYLIFCTVLTRVQKYIEARWNLKEGAV